ncbi:extracellular solute-binding protein [Paenibacillus lemnae]|uniref:Extracellular solute-binding protein n=1 Tax=Paenibacillus lemnae TaxID=1330551 RepID=A0A848M4I7_PAELE|nr:extracellular solute-binding protein [Paenibacillus lemnae]NMO94713.1 extracellular solute-binding protein [Paenibacillus lemnae]
MTRILKKRLATVLSSIICLSMISACSPSGNEGKTEEPAQQSTENVIVDGKFKDTVTMNIARQMTADVTFQKGEDINNNPHEKWVKDKFNIDFNYVWTADSSSIDTKVRLMLSANEELPDIMQFRGSQDVADALIDSGKFMEVGELFEQYAGETWKQAMAEDPSVWNPYTRDGKRYGVPILDYAYNNDPVLWIRDDWMKKFNLEAPKNIEELEAMMDVFANQDPDGNGKKDTVGLAVGFKDGMKTWGPADSGFLFGAYGTMTNQWNLNEEGKLEYGSVQPEAKEVLAKLQDWMKKGYIHKEAGLQDAGKALELFAAGRAGIVTSPYWSAGWVLPGVKEVDPNAEYSPYPLPAGPDGSIGRGQSLTSNGVILINKDFEHPEAFFLYADYLFENQGKPGSDLEYGLAEGYDYLMRDGQPVWSADEFPEDKPFVPVPKYTLLFDGARIPSQMMKTMYDLAGGKEPETTAEKKASTDLPGTIKAGGVNYEQREFAMPNMFNGSVTKTMKKRWDFLFQMEKETFNKIIYGDLPIDAFDSFTEQWKSSGGETITAEVNEWYESVQVK